MDLQANVFKKDGKSGSKISLPKAVFDVTPRNGLLFDAVIAQRAAKRQGTAKTKERAEIRGGGAKPFRQKGTGNARQGTSRSPLMPGGGRTFGPQPRSYEQNFSRKSRREALRVALSQKQRDGEVVCMERLELKAPKTKTLTALLAKMGVANALVVDLDNENLAKSVRNIRDAKYCDVKGLNVVDVLKYRNLVLSTDALKQLEEGLGK